MGILKSPIPQNVMTAIVNYIVNMIDRLRPAYDYENTATGSTTVTLNTKTGLAVFTGHINAASVGTFYLANTNILTDRRSKLNLELEYDFDDGGTGWPQIIHYWVDSDGSCGIKILNSHATEATNADLFVKFAIE